MFLIVAMAARQTLTYRQGCCTFILNWMFAILKGRFISRPAARPLCWRRHPAADRCVLEDEPTAVCRAFCVKLTVGGWDIRSPSKRAECGAGTCGA